VLGIFIALIVVNCTILGVPRLRVEEPLVASALDGLSIGAGSTGRWYPRGLRELVGQGTLFCAGAPLAGDWPACRAGAGTGLPRRPCRDLPPGAFIAWVFLIALKNVIDRRAPAGPSRACRPIQPQRWDEQGETREIFERLRAANRRPPPSSSTAAL